MRKGIKYTALSLAAALIFTLPVNTLSVSASSDVPVNSPIGTVESPNASLNTVNPSSIITKFSGLKLSILGDSISTFDDYIPRDYNVFYPQNSGIPMVEGTWWYQVLNATGMRLCSNASSANTNVLGNSMALDGSAPGCSFRRIMDLSDIDGSAPDVIIIYMGVNDFARDFPVGSFRNPSIQSEGTPATFSSAYELMVQKIKAFYPNASVYCCTLFARDPGLRDKNNIPVNRNGNTIMDYNKQIKAIAAAYGASVIDVYNCGITYDNLPIFTSDGVHPNLPGAQLFANCVLTALMNS